MRRLVLPILLIVGSVLAFRFSDDRGEQTVTAVSSADVSSPTTPLLSARRVPEILDGPRAQAVIEGDLLDIALVSPPLSCLVAVDRDGVELVAHQPDVGLIPASLQKLVTAAAVLDRIGPEARLRTVVGAEAAVVDGTLDGDLFLIGGGDPLLYTDEYAATFSTPVPHTSIAELADAVVAAGITEINGGIVGNDSRYDSLRQPSSWDPDGDLARDGFTGPLGALMINDGFEAFPPVREPNAFPTPAGDPAQHAAAEFDDLLEERGVVIAGGSRNEPEIPTTLVEVAGIESLPMNEIVGQMLTFSDNTTAELLLKELGFVVGADGSTDAGALAALEILGAQGIDIATIRIDDASGLSNRNRLSCRSITDILEAFELDSDLGLGLAVSGEPGTLSERFRTASLRGAVHAKTGTLNSVTALAGFIETTNDQVVAFSYIINLDPEITPELFELQDQLLQTLVGYPTGPSLDELDPLDSDREPAEPFVPGLGSDDSAVSTDEPAPDSTPTQGPPPDEGDGLGPDE
jgi:D-alanyl-D-alanine carboxypeptidase/D-alanyl-D-alanine-endopeptidase (penicillin-binding protein 4)